ncbi:hypothetical protein PCANC_00921 [Puccinia coronata f. sp. avenae]|uniref:Uncharacterized protein n=1 Tax=Puccinia coronata f. sp. avenae TaxID=200324 RepID=A0A2N5VIL7_9BASI|nr:hypothetical protein PCASD_01521 [Puccinia coronata f. sp. avenae]PLW57816.1 hypothetical protein PCANC_00921 [Puccinia coronata f. sp. avenae]
MHCHTLVYLLWLLLSLVSAQPKAFPEPKDFSEASAFPEPKSFWDPKVGVIHKEGCTNKNPTYWPVYVERRCKHWNCFAKIKHGERWYYCKNCYAKGQTYWCEADSCPKHGGEPEGAKSFEETITQMRPGSSTE